MWKTAVVLACGVVLAFSTAGCASSKEKALAGIKQLKEACNELNDKDLAKKIVEDLNKNEVFKKAFDAATEGTRGGGTNYCDPKLHNELQLRIEHGA